MSTKFDGIMKMHFSIKILLILISILFRLLVGLWSYSGEGNSPLFGDFEAQRHWMEITISLPISLWYINSPIYNDLQYWGLDYPPLTAYVSWIFGQIAFSIIPELVEFGKSRGFESINGKFFMRVSVIICDLIIIIPSVLLFSKVIIDKLSKYNSKLQTTLSQIFYILSILLLPSLLLIDHGHFQYNGVCIGLTILSVYFLEKGENIWASIFFTLALNFKQMALYYSPVFFFSLLRRCIDKKSFSSKIKEFFKIGLSVIVIFILLWAPFCIYFDRNSKYYDHMSDEEKNCSSILLQILKRQFPFSRGIFEDKVANIWYSLSVLIDFRQFLEISQMAKLCLFSTLILMAPTCIHLISKPFTFDQFILSLVTCSLSFFLASFQVHEKSILLSLVPASFLMPYYPKLIVWFQLIGTFTMFPLLQREKLRIPYFATLGIYICLSYLFSNSSSQKAKIPKSIEWLDFWVNLLIVSSLAGMIVLHVFEATMPPPIRYPDIYPALFSIFGAANFLSMYIYCNFWLWNLPKDSHNDGDEKKKQ